MTMALDRTPEPSDAALLDAYARGDQSAARALTARHLPRILARALHMLGDRSEAEDVAQETMLRLWKRATTWSEEGAQLSTWLHRVASNLCIDRLRRRAARPTAELGETDPADPSPGAEAHLALGDRQRLVGAAIAALPDRQRSAMVMKYLDERGNPEIAAALEISVDAVESLLARGKRGLAQRLAAHREALL
ncbi:MAG: sigma-70 family RNA polymerase sigma factor [Pseudomonadota bacterium]